MLTGKEFVEQLTQSDEGLFRSSELMVKAYFDSKPSQDELVEHFVGRRPYSERGIIK
jgi:hypothetical protein